MRLSKQQWFGLGGLATAALTALVIVGGIWITHTRSAQAGNTLARCQNAEPAVYMLAISRGNFRPRHINAHVCETLTIVNKDLSGRDIGFELHGKHVSYDGVSTKQLQPDQALTLRLRRLGTFEVREQHNSVVQATFSVSR